MSVGKLNRLGDSLSHQQENNQDNTLEKDHCCNTTAVETEEIKESRQT